MHVSLCPPSVVHLLEGFLVSVNWARVLYQPRLTIGKMNEQGEERNKKREPIFFTKDRDSSEVSSRRYETICWWSKSCLFSLCREHGHPALTIQCALILLVLLLIQLRLPFLTQTLQGLNIPVISLISPVGAQRARVMEEKTLAWPWRER
ncbi:uncharacterized protein B0T23DRAFT_137690 [Neurospora hispaniola]|uniref:Uncharacterized protein n=1 Tax=Neurospora hispaniola TaxID=588809 RepID=A0AAJ0I7L1_9PEZI|nr:hypothetical protein B0T23DRAFT_137690 [Neurospora hispaniola]